MTVYVDDMKAKFRRFIMCHMIADTDDELHEMAEKIGIQRKWFQCPPEHYYQHYDISLTKRKMAVSLGAVEITSRELVRIMRQRKQRENVHQPTSD